MPRLRFTSEAYKDLEQIVGFIGAQNPAAAARLTDRLEHECQRLAQNPGMGQPRSDLAEGLHFLPVGIYLIFYRQESDGIQVIRIIHGSRDYGWRDF